MRATFIPASASGMAQPRMMSSISFGSRPGHAADGFLDGDGGEIVGTRGAQRALKRFSNRRADGTCDDGFFHGVPRDYVICDSCNLHRYWMPVQTKSNTSR